MTGADLAAAAPALILAAGGAVVALLAIPRRPGPRVLAWLGAIVSGGAGGAAIAIGSGGPGFQSTLARDAASAYFAALIAVAAAGALIVAAADPVRRRRLDGGAVALVLFATCGALLIAAAADLVLLFAGLALLSVPLYALVWRGRPGHGGLGYVVLAAAMLAVAAYGIALLYAAGGETGYAGLGRATRNPLYLAGVALVLSGLAFHAGLWPFGIWAAPAADGTPPPVFAFAATVPKIAAFSALLRFAAATKSGEAGLDWEVSLAMLAALSLLGTALLSLTERRVKRLFAYASMSQAGLVAMAAAAFATPAAAFALAVDVALTVGAMAFTSALASDEPTLPDLGGLARRRSIAVGALGLVVLGFVGLPPTAGFLVRLSVLEAAVRADLLWLVVLAALAAATAAAAMLRILLACLGPRPLTAIAPPRARVAAVVVVVAAAGATVAGLAPGPLLEAAAAVRF